MKSDSADHSRRHLPRQGDSQKAGHALRARRLLYRAGRRGTREMDLRLGRFVRAHLESLDPAALAVLEHIVALPDTVLEVFLSTGDLSTGDLSTGDGAGDAAVNAMLRRIAAFRQPGRPEDGS